MNKWPAKAEEWSKTHSKRRVSLPFTPMIDVVFQLLIFFMFSMKFSGYEGRLYAKLPTGIGIRADVHQEDPLDLQTVRIKLLWATRSDWKRYLDCYKFLRCRQSPAARSWWEQNGMVVLKVRNDFLMRGERPDWDALEARLRKAIERHRPTLKNPTLPVIIDASPLVPFQSVVTGLNICAKVGVKNITFAAPEIPF
ncbi:MAG: biopolymer transporter ExbD [Planctomycetota bacterium]|nr:biopolymer transporter ExbD [Planctomycetota bacterium]